MIPVDWLLVLVALLVLARMGESKVLIKTCSTYKAINSASAIKRYCSCSITLCENQYLTIDSCNLCTGDPQFLRVYTNNNTRLVDGYGGYGVSSCAPCARVDNFRPADFGRTGCQTFTIREGCFGSGKCEATVKLYVSNSSIPSNFTYSSVSSMSAASRRGASTGLLGGYFQHVSNYLKPMLSGDSLSDVDDSSLLEEAVLIDGEGSASPTAETTSPPVHALRRRRGRPIGSSSSTTDDSEYDGYCGYKKELNAGVVAGIAVGVTIGAIVLIGIGFVFIRWKRSHDQLVVPTGYEPTHITAKAEAEAALAYDIS